MVEHAVFTSSFGHGRFTRMHSCESDAVVTGIRVLALQGHCDFLEALTIFGERAIMGNLLEQIQACSATVRAAWWSCLGGGVV